MGMFAEALRWFSGRGGVPPQALPMMPEPDPIRASAEMAEQREAYQEPEVYDPTDSDKWPWGNPTTTVHENEWKDVQSGYAYWDQIRSVVFQDEQGHWACVECQLFDGSDSQDTYRLGPFESAEEAQALADEVMANTLASWEHQDKEQEALDQEAKEAVEFEYEQENADDEHSP